MSDILFTPFRLGDLSLPHRLVMAPMTRRRATHGKIQPPFAATYYAQRASAALIVSESIEVDPLAAPEGPTRPGLVDDAQQQAWGKVTAAVHRAGGRIFAQLSHMGRAALPTQLKDNAWPLGPSAIAAEGKVYTAQGAEPHVVPEAMSVAQIKAAVGHYAEAARRARLAGFDGVELHGANGYLIDQFLRDGSNQRDDAYGGSAENRFRFLGEIIAAVLDYWPANRIGVRLSPTNPFQGMSDSDPVTHFTSFAKQLNRFRLAYLHVVEFPVQPEGRPEVARQLRDAFEGSFIIAEGFDRQSAALWLENGWADLVALGKAFLANPDLVERLWTNAPLNAPDKATFYTSGEAGYTDYPTLGPGVERRSGG